MGTALTAITRGLGRSLIWAGERLYSLSKAPEDRKYLAELERLREARDVYSLKPWRVDAELAAEIDPARSHVRP